MNVDTDGYALEQILGMLGAWLILFAYGVMVARPEKKRFYFSVSLLGGLCLLWLALLYRNAGLIVLELAWIGINVWGLLRAGRDVS